MAVYLSSARALHEAVPIPRLGVVIDEAEGEVVVRITGEGSFSQADKLTAALLGLLARRPPLVVLDLSGLNSLSCLITGVLTAFRRAIVRAGGQVRLASALQESVRAALVRTEVLALFAGTTEVQQ
jgi:anti-anti-sigma factor